MVEQQSCSSLVNASTLCAMEQQENANTTSIIAEMSAALERERQKNTELLQRIATLEAQIQERDHRDSLHNGEHVNNLASARGTCKKFKRQKTEASDRIKGLDAINRETSSHLNRNTGSMPLKNANEHRLVNWMSIDETLLLRGDKFTDGDSPAHFHTEDSDDEEDEYYAEDDANADHNDKEIDKDLTTPHECGQQIHEGGTESADNIQHIAMESAKPNVGHETYKNRSFTLDNTQTLQNESEFEDREAKETKAIEDCNQGSIEGTKVIEDYKPAKVILASEEGTCNAVSGGILLRKKSPKVAFCPKEVKRILESEVLKLKNAHSHTMRKIIVFASLGIRHGCEDMYELDFNHFSILKKEEPYISPNNPGEHVLYENPGVQRKIFYPNRHNPTFCPVQILEEEKAMRPSDASCPSCLFLCIKYGGRTRNLPQNEYVRQRMGRNKLKSFGPIMCKMAMLVHIRTGSFFFKALGITLLFMAGFPDELVQKETKYRSLDLVQKYYRTDKDAEGEELFLPDSVIGNPEACLRQQSSRKATSTKSRGKKQSNIGAKPHNLPRPINQLSVPLISTPPSHFGLTGYTSTRTNTVAASQAKRSQSAGDALVISNPGVSNAVHNMSYPGQTPYPMFTPHPPNSIMPMMYWPQNAFPPGVYSPAYSYRPFSPVPSYIPIHQHPFYGHPYSSIDPKIGEGAMKSNAASEEKNDDSESSSSSTAQ